jgi:hypothetical protein
MAFTFPDKEWEFSVREAIKTAGRLPVFEPRGQLSEKDFEITVSAEKQNSFKVKDRITCL